MSQDIYIDMKGLLKRKEVSLHTGLMFEMDSIRRELMSTPIDTDFLEVALEPRLYVKIDGVCQLREVDIMIESMKVHFVVGSMSEFKTNRARFCETYDITWEII